MQYNGRVVPIHKTEWQKNHCYHKWCQHVHDQMFFCFWTADHRHDLLWGSLFTEVNNEVCSSCFEDTCAWESSCILRLNIISWLTVFSYVGNIISIRWSRFRFCYTWVINLWGFIFQCIFGMLLGWLTYLTVSPYSFGEFYVSGIVSHGYVCCKWEILMCLLLSIGLSISTPLL